MANDQKPLENLEAEIQRILEAKPRQLSVEISGNGAEYKLSWLIDSEPSTIRGLFDKPAKPDEFLGHIKATVLQDYVSSNILVHGNGNKYITLIRRHEKR